LTAGWWDEFAARPVVVGQLLPIARELVPSVFEKAKDDASDRALNTRLGKALAAQRDRWFGDLAIRHAGTDAHTKAAAWALESSASGPNSADVDRLGAPSSAEHPQGNEPVSGSFAEDADVADMDSESSGKCLLREPERESSPESVNRYPHLPQHPQTDSEPAEKAADVVRKMASGEGDVPQPADGTVCAVCTWRAAKSVTPLGTPVCPMHRADQERLEERFGAKAVPRARGRLDHAR
jgi:hypothetical protein